MVPEAQKPGTELEIYPENKALGNLSFIRREMTKAMEEVSSIAERGSSILLLALGASILIFAFLFKLQLFGVQVSTLSSAEFISALLVSMVLLLAGSGIRVYQFRTEQEVGKFFRESGIALVSRGMEVGAGLAKEPQPPRTI